ncbi:MAG TPA: response regulator [Pyrinomonadaceae bacterium]|jgi:CheY-like chemotaxis protein
MAALSVTDTSARRRARVQKVLVAEDHADTRLLLRTLLERRGLAVVEAADGVEACDVAERERPDLIFMDGGLPVLDGVAATRRMRGLASLSGVPIVFLSGHAAPQHQMAARDAGCDEYVVKPFDLARLDQILNRLLPARGARKNEGGLKVTRMAQSVLSDMVPRPGQLATPEPTPAQKLLGLVEIDQAGTMLYARFEGDGAAAFGALGAEGRNFYTEVAPFSNVGEFRQHLEAFSKSSAPAHSLNFTCHYEDGPLPVRVLLTRIRERTGQDVTKSILVHIRRAQR